jgi:hypothetical protein
VGRVHAAAHGRAFGSIMAPAMNNAKARPWKIISGCTWRWTWGVMNGRKYTIPSMVPGAATPAAQKLRTK